MEEQWYIWRGEEKLGPMSIDALRAMAAEGKIQSDDFAGQEGVTSRINALDLIERHPHESRDSVTCAAAMDQSEPKQLTSNSRPEHKILITPSALALALIFSFLPWLNITCNGHSLVTQSGFQSCYGGYSFTPHLERLFENANANNKAMDKDAKEDILPAVMVFLALQAVGAGIILGALAFIGNAKPAVSVSPLYAVAYAGAAFLLLTLQMLVGFPLENSTKKKADENQRARRAESFDSSRQSRSNNSDERTNQMAKQLGRSMAEMVFVDSHYTAWLWLTWLATATPLVIFVTEWFRSERWRELLAGRLHRTVKTAG